MFKILLALKSLPATVDAILGLISAVEQTLQTIGDSNTRSPSRNRRFRRRLKRRRPTPISTREVLNGKAR